MASDICRTSRLLQLPGELRNKIYSDVLVDSNRIEIDRHVPQPALLEVCREVRQEAVKIFWTENTFNIYIRGYSGGLHCALERLRRRYDAKLAASHTVEFGPVACWPALLRWLEQVHRGYSDGVGLGEEPEELDDEELLVFATFAIAKACSKLPWAEVVKLVEPQRIILERYDDGWKRA